MNISLFIRDRILRRPKHDRLVLESCPLHTETPRFAAMAPAQVEAACQRGADVIGFTEVHAHLAKLAVPICAKYGYTFYHGQFDSAMAYKTALAATAEDVAVADTPAGMTKVSFDFHGSPTTVFALHWYTDKPEHMAIREAQTHALVAAMAEASRGKRLSFYLADSNPTRPVSIAWSEPRASLDVAGLPMIWAELDQFPAGVGVTTIGRNSADVRVTPVSVMLSDPLGSDHRPGTATYDVKRPR